MDNLAKCIRAGFLPMPFSKHKNYISPNVIWNFRINMSKIESDHGDLISFYISKIYQTNVQLKKYLKALRWKTAVPAPAFLEVITLISKVVTFGIYLGVSK